MKTEFADDIKNNITELVKKLNLEHIDANRIVCMRSYGSTTNAQARIWSLPKIWQKALDVKAHYIIEVVSEHFDNLDENEKTKTLIHELIHIPKTFSGALLSHKMSHFDGKGGRKIKRINRRTVEKIFKTLV